MRILFLIINRSKILLLFIVLEIIAFSLIFNQRSFQRATFLNATNAFSGEIYSQYNQLTSYLNLRVENENLVAENIRLQNLLDRSQIFQSFGADTINDSTYSTRFTTIEAKVIASSWNKVNNYLTIDKGRKSGVVANMGVAGPNGAVGIVRNVSSNFASVLPLINPGITLSGKFKNNDYFGPVTWDGQNYQQAYIGDIPRYAEIKNGDTLVTDSRSLVFPEGILIGTVIGQEKQDDQNFLRLTIKLSTDFSKLENLYIIKDKLKVELDSLKTQP